MGVLSVYLNSKVFLDNSQWFRTSLIFKYYFKEIKFLNGNIAHYTMKHQAA